MKTVLSLVAAAAMAVSLTACGGSESSETSASETTTSTSASASASTSATATSDASAGASALTLEDAWVWAYKADDPNPDMSAMFGELTNTSDKDITLVSGTSDSAPKVELHEVVTKDGKQVMQQKEGGFVVPAGKSITLQPGGDHIMLMDLAAPMTVGTEVLLTLTDADGTEHMFTGTAREGTMEQEPYHEHGTSSATKDAMEGAGDHDH